MIVGFRDVSKFCKIFIFMMKFVENVGFFFKYKRNYFKVYFCYMVIFYIKIVICNMFFKIMY